MLTKTISVPEAIWTASCGAGLVFNARLAYNAVIDLVSLRVRQINSIREYAAITTVIAFASWAIVQMIFVFIGVVAMLNVNVSRVSTFQYVTVGVFLCGTILLSMAGYTVDRRRRHIQEMIANIEQGF